MTYSFGFHAVHALFTLGARDQNLARGDDDQFALDKGRFLFDLLERAADQPSCTVALHRSSQFLGRNNAQAVDLFLFGIFLAQAGCVLVGKHKHRHGGGGYAVIGRIDLTEQMIFTKRTVLHLFLPLKHLAPIGRFFPYKTKTPDRVDRRFFILCDSN